MRPEKYAGAILVVDDDDSVRMVVQAYLEAAGYTVISASDGVLGLAYFKQNRNGISLLLTDVAMPNMSGLDLADRVLELDGTLPVLFMSGTAERADRGYGCVAKPFRCSDLVTRVGEALERQPV